MEYSLINYRKVRSCRTQTKISDTSRLRLLWGIIIISQVLTLIQPTLAEEDDDIGTNRSNGNGISGKFFDYMSNFRSASRPNSETSFDPSSISGRNGSTSTLRNFFRDSNWQETYQKLIDQVRRVRGMISGNSSVGSTGTVETATDSGVIFNATDSLPSSNRSGRINGPYSWNWPSWMSSTPVTSIPTSGSKTPLQHIFFGPFDSGRDSGRNYIPTTGFNPSSSGYYPPPPPGPGSALFGPGSPSQTHFNYVYKYNPKTNSATDLEQHTTTTIYIICICLVIMLVGTILFAFVSKCQEANGRPVGGTTTTPTPARSRRRRGQQSGSSSNNNNTNTITNTSAESTFTTPGGRPEISIIMPNLDDCPPAYPKVIFEAPPTYDSLFGPVESVKQ